MFNYNTCYYFYAYWFYRIIFRPIGPLPKTNVCSITQKKHNSLNWIPYVFHFQKYHILCIIWFRCQWKFTARVLLWAALSGEHIKFMILREAASEVPQLQAASQRAAPSPVACAPRVAGFYSSWRSRPHTRRPGSPLRSERDLPGWQRTQSTHTPAPSVWSLTE